MIVDTKHTAAYTADDGTFALNVHRTGADAEGKPQWSYTVHTDGALLTSGSDLHGWADARAMLASLARFLESDGERYRRFMGPTPADIDPYSFSEAVAEWAYGVSDELSMAAEELDPQA